MSDELYLEKMRISERLESLEKTSIAHIAHMTTWMEKTEKLLEKHSEEIWGNSHPGLKTNVDRLSQIEKGRAWVLKILAGGLLGKIGLDFWQK